MYFCRLAEHDLEIFGPQNRIMNKHLEDYHKASKVNFHEPLLFQSWPPVTWGCSNDHIAEIVIRGCTTNGCNTNEVGRDRQVSTQYYRATGYSGKLVQHPQS